MRSFILILVCVFLVCKLNAQATQKAPLKLENYSCHLNVTRGEQLFVATRSGEVATSNSIKDYWYKISLNKSNSIKLSGATIDNINFFNADTGFVSGFISNNGKYDIIYRTTDHGKTWQAKNFGQDGWIDDAVNLDNGEAWLSVSGSGIAYSNDYGNNWRAVEIPNLKQRFATIFFNKQHEGIIGSLWNMIAITNNNCDSWKQIPSPLDQKKYRKTNPENRPEINKVAFYHDYILCVQEGMVFYSKRDTINWIWLPAYANFYTDAENAALFFLDNKSQIVKPGNDFSPVFTFHKIEGNKSYVCKNGKLFIFNHSKMMELRADNTTISAEVLTDDTVHIEPHGFDYAKNGWYGNIDKKIFFAEGFSQDWKYLFTLPFEVNYGRLFLSDSNTVAFVRNDDSIFYYNFISEKSTATSKESMFANFCKAGILQITFSKGSQGCFHGYTDELKYNYDDGVFEKEAATSRGSKHKNELPANSEQIEASLVETFTKQLPFFINQYAVINELGFTEKDYAQCRKDIHDFENAVAKGKIDEDLPFQLYENNIDFPRLYALVDSIKVIDSVQLNNYLSDLNQIYSTTTNWISVKLINNNNETMNISNRFSESNAFYFPWQIELNGYSTRTTSMQINHFIEKTYPEFLDRKNKVKVLREFVKKLY